MASEQPASQAQTDTKLAQQGYRTGSDVETAIVQCYGTWLGSTAVATAQLASLKAAWRAEWDREHQHRPSHAGGDK